MTSTNNTNTPIQPAPPRPPRDELTVEWANQLTRWLENQLRLGQFPYLRGSGLFLVDLPTSGYALKPGTVFSNGGVLTIVQVGDIWIGGQPIAAGLGTLTVTV